MIRLSKMSLRLKLALTISLVSVIPLVVMAVILNHKAGVEIEARVRAQLESVAKAKQNEISTYLKEIHEQIITFSENLMVVDAALAFQKTTHDLPTVPKDELRTYYNEFARNYKEKLNREVNINNIINALDATAISMQHRYIVSNPQPIGDKLHFGARGDQDHAGDLDYDQVHKKYHGVIRSCLERFGYYDIFLVEPEEGRIVYSVYKENDYGTRLSTGPWKDSGIARVFTQAKNLTDNRGVVWDDYVPYTPSSEAPASFIASPIQHNGKTIAIAIFQMPLDRISATTGTLMGLGETEETYLVGDNHLLRSDPRLHAEAYNVEKSYQDPDSSFIKSHYVDLALAGESGTVQGLNYCGQDVYAAYFPIDLWGKRWAMISELSTEEALSAVADMRSTGYIISIVAIILVLLTAILFAKQLAKHIQFIAGQLQTIGSEITSAASQVAQAAGLTANGSMDQSQATQAAAGLIQNIDQLSGKNIECVQQTNSSIARASDLLEQSGSISNRLDTSMQGLLLTQRIWLRSSKLLMKLLSKSIS